MTSPRLTYFITVPFAALSTLALIKFREPRLHRAERPGTMRAHLAATRQALTTQGRLLPIIALAVLTSLLLQTIIEFGPLWLVAPAAPAILYGPFWAALTSTLGLGGLLAGRLRLGRPIPLATVIVVMPLAGLALTTSGNLAVITVAEVGLGLLVVTVSIHVGRRLHDAVPSTVRNGVASGVSTLSWLVFLPFSLVFGWVSKQYGVHTAGWMITAAAALAGAVLVKGTLDRRPAGEGAEPLHGGGGRVHDRDVPVVGLQP